MTRERLFGEIATERLVQDSIYGGPEHDDAHTAEKWVALICRHAGLGIDDGAASLDPVRYRRQLVRVAALAVAALESLDRHGERVAGQYREGSGF